MTKLDALMISVQNYFRAERYLSRAGASFGAMGTNESRRGLERACEELRVATRAAGRDRSAAGTGAFGHILVAIGPSERSVAALSTAIRMAEALNARLFLVYVYTPLRGLSPEFGYIEPDVHDDTIRNARGRLDRARAMVPEGIPAETVLREGDPADEILRVATTVHADLIVMGTRGRGRVAQALMGSVTTDVIQKARCPVLTVSPAVEAETDIARQGLSVAEATTGLVVEPGARTPRGTA